MARSAGGVGILLSTLSGLNGNKQIAAKPALIGTVADGSCSVGLPPRNVYSAANQNTLTIFDENKSIAHGSLDATFTSLTTNFPRIPILRLDDHLKITFVPTLVEQCDFWNTTTRASLG
jgi:hypothetical protein